MAAGSKDFGYEARAAFLPLTSETHDDDDAVQNFWDKDSYSSPTLAHMKSTTKGLKLKWTFNENGAFMINTAVAQGF